MVRGFPSLVSFPHYFLQATGHLAEQLKTREWVVARITSITERVVDVRVSLHYLYFGILSYLSFVISDISFSGCQYESVRSR